MIDCGEGSLGQIDMSQRVRLSRLHTICITHLHGDHCYGIWGILHHLRRQNSTQSLTIVGPKGVRELAITMLGDDAIPLNCRFYELDSLECETVPYAGDGKVGHRHEDIEILAIPIQHRVVQCYGYVFLPKSKGTEMTKRAVVVLQDCCSAPKVIDVFSERKLSAFVVVHEATLHEDLKELAISRGHSTPKMAAGVANSLRASYTVLSHFR